MMLYRIDSAYTCEILMVEPLSPDPGWMSEAIGGSFCEVCRCIDRTRFPEPCDLVVTGSVEEQAVATVETIHLQVFRRDLIEALSDDMKGFVFGAVDFATEQEAEFVTCYCLEWIALHGGPQSKYAVCPKCNAMLSHLGNSPEFVLAGDITDRKVYQDSRCRLYLSEQAATGLDESKWDEVVLSPIPVHDGLGKQDRFSA